MKYSLIALCLVSSLAHAAHCPLPQQLHRDAAGFYKSDDGQSTVAPIPYGTFKPTESSAAYAETSSHQLMYCAYKFSDQNVYQVEQIILGASDYHYNPEGPTWTSYVNGFAICEGPDPLLCNLK